MDLILVIFELMQDVHLRLGQLEEKITQLIQKIEYLRKENIMLIEENVKLKQELEKNKSGSAGNQRGRVGENNEGELGATKVQAEKMKRDLEKYIVEVDKCIELINHM